MGLPIQKLREIVFHLLYSNDFEALNEDVIPFLMQHHHVTKKSLYKAQDIVNELKKHRDEIDKSIITHSKEYEFDRIPRVEKNLLRLGIFEMLYSEEVPPKVAISEAIRLARKFATAESAHFVNAILDTIYKKSNAV
ncbi:MAG: transcription antitermination factor NusB [Rhabdochlamydiaceae bacterium]